MTRWHSRLDNMLVPVTWTEWVALKERWQSGDYSVCVEDLYS